MVSIDQEQFEALAQTKTAWFLQKNSKRVHAIVLANAVCLLLYEYI